jgi:hypothetical protein
MSLILSGTDGLSDVDGSAATPAIRGTDANTGIFFGTDIIGFSEGGVEAMRINASGDIGIGTASPQARLDVRTAALGTALQLTDDTNYGANFIGVSGGLKLAMNGSQTFAIFQSTNERMRIDSSGNVIVGGTSTSSDESTYQGGGVFVSRRASSAGTTHANFLNGGSTVGSITSNTTATFYNTSSDYRLKNTIAPMTGALDKVALLKPCTYKWNVDGSDGQGFIAHELQEVIAGCVTGEKTR